MILSGIGRWLFQRWLFSAWPEVDGLETLRRLREDDKELPVIKLSCVREAGTIKEAFRCSPREKLSERRSQKLRIPLLPPPHVRY